MENIYEQKFSFRYPNNWFIEPTEVEEGGYINFFLDGTEPDPTKNMHKFGNEIFKVMVYGDESVFNSIKNLVPAPRSITIVGKPALKSDTQVDILIGSTNKKVLHLEIREASKPFIDQIISTVKIIDP